MIPRECKRLAEVDFPIAVVSKHATKEKTIRHGHPSTLHLWWARRPLASSRAVLLALLLPDPCDEHCPADFRIKAKKLLPQVGCGKGETDNKLREGLLKFIGDFANWDLASSATYLEVARGLVKAAHPEETPLVVDPFAGGGSIPLEALRLGCDAFASDLNPVACLILKIILEDIPRNGLALAEELRKARAEIKRQAEIELTEFYPPDPDGARPIAYLWARTVRCEAPDCGAEIPLMRSCWLSKKANRRRALRLRAVKPRGGIPHVEFEIFEPKSEDDVPKGTVSRAKATCVCCGRTLAPDRVRSQLTAQCGGADTEFDVNGQRLRGAQLLSVVTLSDGQTGRQYRLPQKRDYEAVLKVQKELAKVAAKPLANGLSAVPNEPTPAGGGSGAGRAFSVQKYGMMKFGDLFTARQKYALLSLVRGLRGNFGHAARDLFGLLLSKFSELATANCLWEPVAECPRKIFNMQALPMQWNFAEGVVTAESSGSFTVVIDNVIHTLEAIGFDWAVGQLQLADACSSPLPSESCGLWFTDPPYYDAVPYSDLSDFFFVWLKRVLSDQPLLRDPTDPRNPLTPKVAEIVQDERKFFDGKQKDRSFFEAQMGKAFREGRRILRKDGIGAVVFAHKSTEGWEALLSGMLAGGWTIVASWPIATEQANRPRARESAALATSVHLICRPRTEDRVGDWGDVLRELPKRVVEWMLRLQAEHVRGADLVFACIGPALEIFSRYVKVETADGRGVPLSEYLEKVWEVVGRSALEQILGDATGGAGALEEDARLTALFLWTLQSSNGVAAEAGGAEQEADDDDDEAPKKKKAGFSLIFDVARRFAQPLGIHLPEWEGRIIEIEKGVVRLLPVAERAKQLFGEDGTRTAAAAFERNAAAAPQMVLFPDEQAVAPEVKGRGRKKTGGESKPGNTASAPTRREATTLDRVHAAMLLQRSGQANALRALLQAEQDRGPDFLRLANALSALYPRESEEKRLLDAMLLALPR